jgi:hypothetical protein
MESLNVAAGFRLDPEAEFNGADLTSHKIGATAERRRDSAGRPTFRYAARDLLTFDQRQRRL